MADPNIFVSYARVDTNFAIKLATSLKEAGANLWLDQLDIVAGETWDFEIEKALTACDGLLFIVSKASVASNNVLNEVYYALEEKKRVLPVKIDDCRMPFRISRLQYIDLSSNYDDGFKHLLNALRIKPKSELIEKTPEEEKISTTASANNEDQTWREAKDENSKASYEKYLEAFANGRYKGDALIAIDMIASAEETEKKRQREETLWNKACKSDSIESYRNYISNSELATHTAEATKAISAIETKIKEDDEWQNAMQINSIYAFKNYLKQYSSGKHAALALSSIKELENSAEEALWNEAKLSNTIISFQNYLKNTISKKHTEEAERFIREIKKRDDEKDDEAFWLNAVQNNTIAGYRNYLNKFKSGNYVDTATRSIKKLEQKNISSAAGNEAEIPDTFYEKVDEKEGESIREENVEEQILQTRKAKAKKNRISYSAAGLLAIIIIVILVRTSKPIHSGSSVFHTDAATTMVPGNTPKMKQTDSLYKLAEKNFKSNSKTTFQQFQKIIEIGDTNNVNYSNSLYYLGILYEIGGAVGQNPKKCLEALTKASEKGNLRAMGELGGLYTTRFFGKKNIAMANKWYKRAGRDTLPN